MSSASDTFYINKTLELAKKGIGNVNPNPLVGAIVVKNNSIIGTGYHECFGKEHAEINALNATGEKARGATLYVNLEPCCHYGKTPPCTDAIIKAGIKRVVIGMVDPNPLVNQQGIKALQERGIDVTFNVEKEKCEALNRVFIKYIKTKLPFVTLKIAQSIDGRIATETGHSQWITSELARKEAHRLRAENDAVIVGIKTVITDDPQLTVRLVKGNNPVRIVLDSYLKIPLSSRILNDSFVHQTIIATTSNDENKTDIIRQRGAHVWQLEKNENGKVSIAALISKIGHARLSAVMVEGGSQINTSFLKAKMLDRIVFAIAPKILGSGINAIGDLGVRSVDESHTLNNIEIKQLGTDFLIYGDVKYHKVNSNI